MRFMSDKVLCKRVKLLLYLGQMKVGGAIAVFRGIQKTGMRSEQAEERAETAKERTQAYMSGRDSDRQSRRSF